MVDALASANYWFALPAAGMYLVSIYFRSMRWTVMLRHLKPVKTDAGVSGRYHRVYGEQHFARCA